MHPVYGAGDNFHKAQTKTADHLKAGMGFFKLKERELWSGL